jgi:glycosyltransferase involved in cell wall biosynthesis
LNKKFEVNLLGRKSFKKRSHEIKIKKTKVFNNIFSYLSEVKKASKIENSKFLIISISPYTFLVSLFIKILGKKPIVYLRSDGYGEYKAILGKAGPLIYHFMFSITSSISNLISCRDYILKGKKGKIINPSQLDSVWLRQPKNTEIKNFKLLYVGRLRAEKGVYSLSELIRNKRDISLTIVGAEKSNFNKINQSNIKTFPTQNNKTKLIKYYDDHNVFILPSFTEGHPMVLLEALARRRPVVVFDEIKHVIGEKKGIFVSKRNFLSFLGTLNNIKKNYKKIQKDMKKNKLPTNKEFIDKFIKFIDDFD